MSRGAVRPDASQVSQLSVHPYPSEPGDPGGAGVPATASRWASCASYVRENSSGGPNVGMLRSVFAWVKSPFSVLAGSPAVACATPGAAGFDPPPAAPAGTCPPPHRPRPPLAVE